MTSIKHATIEDLGELAALFDGYRQFYEQESDISAAKKFLQERIEKHESVILMASINNKAVGFTQLYPSFSSVSMQRLWILNDLFVLPETRGKKIGETLLNAAKDFVKTENAKGLALETAQDNPAQKLYERLGWKKDEGFYHYFWKNDQH